MGISTKRKLVGDWDNLIDRFRKNAIVEMSKRICIAHNASPGIVGFDNRSLTGNFCCSEFKNELQQLIDKVYTEIDLDRSILDRKINY